MALTGIPSRRYRGGAVVEAAIAMPILLLLTFATIEYGWVFYNMHLVSNAARHGARVGARADTTVEEVQAAVSSLMTAARLDSTGYTLGLSPGDPAVMDTGQMLTVTITVPYSSIELVGLPLVPVPANLVGSVTMAREGP